MIAWPNDTKTDDINYAFNPFKDDFGGNLSQGPVYNRFI